MNISEKSKKHIDSCRFCWMCRHICPIGNATGLERNTARARALSLSMVYRGAEKLEDMADNLFECALCGACVKECVTGWDPVSFTVEAKTQASLSGALPAYILKLVENFQKYGNVYGAALPEASEFSGEKTDTLLYFGETTRYKNTGAVRDVSGLLRAAGVSFTSLREEEPSGYSLFYLTGKTAETRAQMQKCADLLNGYRKVVVYDPADLKLMLREYREWGVELTAEIVSFHTFLKELLKSGALKVKRSERIYTPQDNFNYSRELEDVTTLREILGAVGTVREMLLSGRDTMFAGSLLMNEYMPDVMRKVAMDRWENMRGMGLDCIVTESSDEQVLLRETAPAGCRVLSAEQAVLENR